MKINAKDLIKKILETNETDDIWIMIICLLLTEPNLEKEIDLDELEKNT